MFVIGCFVTFNARGQQYEKNSIVCLVIEKTGEAKNLGINALVQRETESAIIGTSQYKVITREEEFLKYRDFLREYEAADKGNVDITTISDIGVDFGANFVCWVEIESIEHIYIRLINVGTTVIEATARGTIVGRKLVITENTKGFLGTLRLDPIVSWSNFSRLYHNQTNQFYLTLGNGINYGNICGVNIGWRFGGVWGGGFQAGIGLGSSSSNSYLHYAGGVKLYYHCFFLSANYGISDIKYYNVEEIQNTAGGDFTYFQKEKKEYYHGPSFLVGTDYCFGKNPITKHGGVVNIALGTSYNANKRWGFAWNVGIGFAFNK